MYGTIIHNQKMEKLMAKTKKILKANFIRRNSATKHITLLHKVPRCMREMQPQNFKDA